MLNLIGPLANIVDKVVDRAIPDKDKANELKQAIQAQLIASSDELVKAQRDIIVAEANSKSLASLWRPILMLTFVAIIANNYILAPYVQLFFSESVVVPIPEQMWSLIQIGVGGYIAGRSGEKIIKEWGKK